MANLWVRIRPLVVMVRARRRVGKCFMSTRVLTKIEGLMCVWFTVTRLEVTGRK